MSIEQYIENRVVPLILWFTKNSRRNRIAYHSTKVVLTATAAITPAIASFIKVESQHNMQTVLGITTVSTAILANINNIFNFKDKFITFRDAAEFIKSEQILFETQAGKYKNNPNKESDFIEVIEKYMININVNWKKMLDPEKDSN